MLRTYFTPSLIGGDIYIMTDALCQQKKKEGSILSVSGGDVLAAESAESEERRDSIRR